MLIKPDWNVFRVNFSDNPQKAFECQNRPIFVIVFVDKTGLKMLLYHLKKYYTLYHET